VDQNIPLGPVDRRQALRRHWRRRRRSPRPRFVDGSLLLGLAGMLLAAGGFWLSTLAPRVEVGMDAHAYTIGGARLPAAGKGVYAGGDGVVVVDENGASFAAAASATLNGAHMVGRCTGRSQPAREQCSFRSRSTPEIRVQPARDGCGTRGSVARADAGVTRRHQGRKAHEASAEDGCAGSFVKENAFSQSRLPGASSTAFRAVRTPPRLRVVSTLFANVRLASGAPR
jgi:hypothetical protein